MKKFIAIILACVLMFALQACSGTENGGNEAPAAPAQPKDISPDEVPASLTDFLWLFTDFYQGNKYDSAAPDDCLLLDSIISDGSCVDWSLYHGSEPVEHWNDGTSDPRGWMEGFSDSYKEYDKKTVDEIAVKVFNLTEEQLAKQIENGLAHKTFYAEGDKYYCLIGGVGDSPVEYVVTSAKSDGSKYYVNYNCYYNNGEQNDLLASYTAAAELKKDGGSEYWSLYSMERLDNAG